MRISLPKNFVVAASGPHSTRAGRSFSPFVVVRGPVAREGLPPLQPDLKLDDTAPFRLSRNHFMIERREGSYYVRDLCSTLGTIVNGEPIGDHFRGDDAPLRAGENEVIAGGIDSPFVFSVSRSLKTGSARQARAQGGIRRVASDLGVGVGTVDADASQAEPPFCAGRRGGFQRRQPLCSCPPRPLSAIATQIVVLCTSNPTYVISFIRPALHA